MVSGTLTLFLVFKILAVADWDPTTAKGIIAASGTTNVLVGATLVALPTLYACFVVAGLPRIQARLEMRNRTNVERSAAQWAESAPLLLLLFLVPTYLIIGIVVLLLARIAVKIVGKRRAAHPGKPGRARPENQVSRFEANAATLAAVLAILWGSLWEPWLPTEAITPADGERQVAYVLSQDDHHIVVLLDAPRRLQRWAVGGLTRDYCLNPTFWWQRTVIQQIHSKPGYPRCP